MTDTDLAVQSSALPADAALTANAVLEILHTKVQCDPISGVLFWRSGRRRGQEVGWIGANGYRATILLGRKKFYVHRLLWLWVHGNWPRDQIDHINGNRLDNRIANLREASVAQNGWNSKSKTKRADGLKGITFHSLSGLWQARIRRDGRVYQLGYFRSPREAHAAYAAASRLLHGEFGRVA